MTTAVAGLCPVDRNYTIRQDAQPGERWIKHMVTDVAFYR